MPARAPRPSSTEMARFVTAASARRFAPRGAVEPARPASLRGPASVSFDDAPRAVHWCMPSSLTTVTAQPHAPGRTAGDEREPVPRGAFAAQRARARRSPADCGDGYEERRESSTRHHVAVAAVLVSCRDRAQSQELARSSSAAPASILERHLTRSVDVRPPRVECGSALHRLGVRDGSVFTM